MSKLKLEPSKIVILAKINLTEFKRKIAIGENDNHPLQNNIRLHECYLYHDLWKSIINKEGKDLSLEECDEIKDALYSGEYDAMLGIDSEEIDGFDLN